jgi:hypothetical protein
VISIWSDWEWQEFYNPRLKMNLIYTNYETGPTSSEGDISPFKGLIPRVLDYLFWLIAREERNVMIIINSIF